MAAGPSIASADKAESSDAPTASKLHERAATSARETRQAVLTMATASLGFFFVAITSKDAPALPAGQQCFLGVSLGAMAATVAAALWSAWSDARWSYCWAEQMDPTSSKAKDWESEKKFWHFQKNCSANAMLILFGAGVIAAAIYMILRVTGG